MSTPKETITKIYHAYMPEMIEYTINIYEQYRNLKPVKGCAPYKVNRKRFNDDFWRTVIAEHIKHRLNPDQTIPFARHLCGGQMPWPDLIRKMPEMISIDDRWQEKLKSSSTDEFNLGHFKGSDTPQKLEEAIERWNTRNPEVTPADDISVFCVELASRNWSFLLEDPEGRDLTASVLLKATEQEGLEQLDKVFRTHLQELADQL